MAVIHEETRGTDKKNRKSKKGKKANVPVNADGKRLTSDELETKKKRLERSKDYTRKQKYPGSQHLVRVDNKAAQLKMKRMEKRITDAADLNLAREDLLLTQESGFLEAESPLEDTGRVTQGEIAQNVATSVAKQVYKLKLDEFGPYRPSWSRNGRHLLIGGGKGHVAMMDVLRMSLVTELTLGPRETARDVCFLHNENLFAVAQKKHLFIYDQDGVEVHCIRQHVAPTRLSFLPYHMLLACVGMTGFLKYQDVSTGDLVSEHRSKLGACDVMCQNPHTGVMHLGHQNGAVTLWSPATPAPLVRMLAHPAPVRAVAVDPSGVYMATAAANTGFKIFDLRTLRELHNYTSVRPVSDLDISQRGILAVGFGSHVQMWRDSLRRKGKRPYMRHELPGSSVSGLKWRPYEDVLAVGHETGYHSVVVPGAGEPNYDALEANPFESKKERREAEVHQLLDKLPPETIAMDPDFIGDVDSDKSVLLREQMELANAANTNKKPDKKEKKKQRGRSKTGAKLRKKRKNVMDEEKALLKKRREEEIEEKKEKRSLVETERRKGEAPIAIRRFF